MHQLRKCTCIQTFHTQNISFCSLKKRVMQTILIDHENNNGSFLDKQPSMFSELLEIDYIITGPQHLRPPSDSTPGHVCCLV